MPVGLVFPGQGTQRQGMGAPWQDTQSWSVVEEISAYTGHDVEELLLRTGDEYLRRTDLAQIAVFTVTVMAYQEAKRRGRTANAVACAGHSLGEYAALLAAGALNLRDAAVLVAARGTAMREASLLREGTMGALVGASREDAERLIDQVRESGSAVWLANVNAPGQVVVTGSVEGILRIADASPAIGAKLIRLPVGGAFHSPFMEHAADRLREVAKTVTFADRHLPVVANVDAEPYATEADWPTLAVRQLTEPVLWTDSVRTLTKRLGCRLLIELGPGSTLSGMIRRISRGTEILTVNRPEVLV